MKALVTGAAGFIGSHLCERLTKDGHQVIGLDNLQTGKMSNLVHLNKSLFTFVFCDITNFGVLEQTFREGITHVFHQAASKKTICEKSPPRDLEINGGGTLNLLMLSKKYKVKKFIHASTGSVYGEVSGVITEKTPTNPVSYYGVSKLAGEKYVSLFKELNTTILRYFHVYGERQDDSDNGGVVAIFKRNIKNGEPLVIYGDGEQERSFTHVSDVVEANIRALEDNGGIYNCASGLKITLNKLVTILGAKEIVYKDWKPGDIKRFDIDNSLIKSKFAMDFKGFEP